MKLMLSNSSKIYGIFFVASTAFILLWAIWSPSFPQDGVTIETDKSVYIYGEEVRIRVQNNLDKEIWFNPSFVTPFTTTYLENKETDGKWVNIYVFNPAPVPILKPSEWIDKSGKNLGVGGEFLFVWDQKRSGDSERIQVEPGLYRIKFTYYTFDYKLAKSLKKISDWENVKEYEGTVYSTVFEIR